MSETSTATCPQCGAPLPAAAPAGLCPRCLMALNLQTETVLSDDSTTAQPPLPPEQLTPHFPQLEILECLGRGGMGVVYKARQKSLNRFVALKLLAPERVHDAKFAERFTREAQALAALNHPNIVTIYDFGQAGGFYFLLMELVDGANLRQLLRTHKFTPEEALAIVPTLCDALQYAHDRGIVHRDIKPENLLMDKTGRVKVADFGVAKMLGPVAAGEPLASSAPGNATQAALGTPGYSAPEQKTDPQRVDSRADIYSLGVVFYEMLTGELPGSRIEPPSSRMGGMRVDVRLDEVVLRALEKQPELRYQQASVLKTQVETIRDSQAGGAAKSHPSPDDEDLFEKYAGHWGWRGVMVAALILIFTNAGDKAWDILTVAYLVVMAARDFLGIRYTRRKGWTLKDSDGEPENEPTTGEPGRAADVLPAVESWLAIMDSGDYGKSWEAAAPYFQRVMAREKWIGLGEKVRRPLGPLLARQFKSAAFTAAGTRLAAKFDTSFDGLLAATETVTFARQAGGDWRAIGYLIRPAGHAPRQRMKWLPSRRRLLNWSGIVVLYLILHAYAVQPFIVRTDAAAPELPRGSHFLVWKLTHTFTPGDLVCYRNDGYANVGRVVRSDAEAIEVNRNGQASMAVPRAAIIGKVICVYWRASYAPPAAAPASAETWSPDLAPGAKPDLEKIREDIKTQMDQTNYEAALGRQLWYFDHALQYGGSDAVRLSFGTMNWGELARDYPKAHQALIEIRDLDQQKFQAADGFTTWSNQTSNAGLPQGQMRSRLALFQEMHELNDQLGDNNAQTALVKTLVATDPKLARNMGYKTSDDAFDSFVKNAATGTADVGDGQAAFAAIRQQWESLRKWEVHQSEMHEQMAGQTAAFWAQKGMPPPAMAVPLPPPKAADSILVDKTRQLIGILINHHRKADAEKIRDDALARLDDPWIKSAVTDAEAKAAQPANP